MTSVVKSAERVLQVLLLLGRNNTALSTQQIAQACNIPKSSAHHLLNVMSSKGFITYDARERCWRPGPANLEVGRAYLRSDPLQAEARNVMRELSEAVGVTSHLAVLDGEDVLYIRKTEPSKNAIRLVTETGMRLPAHVTSVGLAILARLPDSEIIRRFKPGKSAAGDTDDLMQTLRKVRRDGFARDNGMVTPGIACIASAVVNGQGVPIASIGITYVAAQMKAPQAVAATNAVRHAADRLSRATDRMAVGEQE